MPRMIGNSSPFLKSMLVAETCLFQGACRVIIHKVAPNSRLGANS